MTENKWYSQTREEVQAALKVTMKGLSQSEIEQSRSAYGSNQLETTKEKSTISRLISQFKDPLILILLGASILSMFLGDVIEAYIILSIVFLNAIIGFIQEGKAEQSLKALQEMSSPFTKVIRNGKEVSIASRDVVVGDICVLEAGDLVSADIRLIQTNSLQVQEASLTGESIPVDKDATYVGDDKDALGDRKNMAYSSGMVTYGRGLGVVVGVGMGTEVGKIAKMLQSSGDEQTPLQRKLDQLGKQLGLLALAACVLIFVITLLKEKTDILDAFMTAVSLAVAVIPEGLPAISTIVLAMGVNRLVEKNAIIRTLPSVETLGSATVICSDKTGTLTQNKMTVVDFWNDNNPANREQLVIGSLLCNDSRLIDGVWVGDPTETALSEWAQNEGHDTQKLLDEYKRINEIPFDSGRKRMTTVHNIDGKIFAFTKGGVDEVLAVSTHYGVDGTARPLTQDDVAHIQQANEAMAVKALRVLALSVRELTSNPHEGDISIESNLTFVGLVGMIDPPRPEVVDAVKVATRAGIRTVMITGDHALTAEAIAREIGMIDDHKVITGVELEQMSDDKLFEQVEHIGVYARVSPEDKMRIIKAWKRHGEIVAMTGDGVNDAPALKMADIGAAMGIVGTEVAKGAADMILTDDNFATVVTAVEEGRRIKDNIMKAVNYLLSCNVGELFAILIATLFGIGRPLLTIHILCVNLITDSLPALALGVEPAESDIMDRKPSKDMSLLTFESGWRIIYQGIFISIITLCAYTYGTGVFINQNGSPELGQTMAFSVLALSQLVHSFNIHAPSQSVFKTFFKNKWLIYAVIINAMMVMAALLIPFAREILHLTTMNTTQWGIVIVLALGPIPFVELMKLLGLNNRSKTH
ncbi:ATPase [Erysipelothrix larvae]|uniref:P-type Ca(2+) transporter n=1 Tax=Erysipelothrix larvae TaxID=1514105 RepID=A0A109UH22_9FIRM|nr:cation-translocating P-type ATPase [Erysipelothrix larvae]AMC93541.1 ATPase [Erysipelothrix larvae]